MMAAAGGAVAGAGAAVGQAYGSPPPGSPPPGGPAPYGAPGAPAMAPSPGGEVRGDFSGTGGELLGPVLGGAILTAITLYIYYPWFICKLMKTMMERITFGPTSKGVVRFRFEGKGGELFVLGLVQLLLTVVTVYIYLPWAVCKLTKWFTENVVVTTDDGSEYRFRFDGTGGELFLPLIGGMILSMITLYIYMPWFICKMNRWFYSRIKITKNGQEVGGIEFTGEGGELFVTFLVGMILTVITLYIYYPWFLVKLINFNCDNTKINIEGKRYGIRFSGMGGELFVIGLVGAILTVITLYIYLPWFMAKMLKWQYSNLAIVPEGGAPMAMGAPAGGGMVQQVGGPPQGQMPGQFGQPQQQLGAAPQQGYGQPPQGGYGGPPQGGAPPPGGGYGPPQGGGYGPPPGGGYGG